ncbi:MAG: hypothetical protein AB2814_08770 [Candidatus Sedimenticola endophacoides]
MLEALGELKQGRTPQAMLSFAELRARIGFDEYDRTLNHYPEPLPGTDPP